MPALIDTPESREPVEPLHLHAQRPQARAARPGFWRTLAHGISTHLTPTPRERHVPACSARRPFETPMDQLAREHPSISLYVLAMI